MIRSQKKKIILSAILSIALIISLGISSVAAIPNDNSAGFVDVLIGFDRTPGPVERGIVEGKGGNIKYSYTLVPAIAASVPQSAIPGLLHNSSVIRVEPDIKVNAIEPEESTATIPWGVNRINTLTAHDDGYKGSEVKVAILDSGIDLEHQDLNVAGGVRFYTVNTGPPWQRGTFNDDDYDDVYGHGTHVAGTVAALGQGVLGVAPEVSLYAVKILGDDGSGNYSDVIAGLQWAVDNGMKITNNSYGSSSNPGSTVQEAFDNAYTEGLLHVAAAGNTSGGSVIYPAKFDSVIAVSATTEEDELAEFSSVGSEVELAAPGKDILSTWNSDTSAFDPQPIDINGDWYKYASGTSMASPHVAGTAALVWAMDSGLTNEKVREVLQDTAEKLKGLSEEEQGHGLVNAAAAVGVEVASLYLSPSSKEGEAWPGDDIVYEFIVENAGDTEDTYDLSVNSEWTSLVDPTSVTLGAGDSTTVSVTHSVPEGTSAGDTDKGIVEAVSSDTGASASAEFITTTQGYAVEITPDTQEDSGAPGDTVEYIYTVSNTGTEDDSYNLEITDASWEAGVIDSSGPIAAGESVEVTVSHTIPEDTEDVDFDTGTLIAVSATDSDVSASAIFTTTARTEAMVSIEVDEWWTQGGRNDDRHLRVRLLALVDQDLVSGVTIDATLEHEDGPWNFSGTTDEDGEVTFDLNNAPDGNYKLIVDEASHDTLVWDEKQPENNTYPK